MMHFDKLNQIRTYTVNGKAQGNDVEQRDLIIGMELSDSEQGM